jgi:hypothetical protein
MARTSFFMVYGALKGMNNCGKKIRGRKEKWRG